MTVPLRAARLSARLALVLWLAGAAHAQVGVLEPARLVAGPMLADVTHRTAMVWVQTDRPGTAVSLRLALTSDAERARPVETPPVTTDAHGIATVPVGLLEPGQTYGYTVLVDGREEARPYPTEIRTQPLWQWRTDPPEVTIAIGSCYYANETAYDRPGNAYGGPPTVFESIADLRPDAMIWLGDNVYLREVDWWSAAGIEHRYAHARREPALQRLLATSAHYATWDDHDFGPNDSDRSYVLKDVALDAFARYWPAASRGIDGVPGVFTQFQWGDADVFLLDNRYHRAPNRAPAGERTLLGPAQMQWLLDALTFSRAPFKIVAIGGQVLNPAEVYETYANIAPAERQRLLDEIAAREIDGVVFLSGDRHHAELNRLERPGTYPLYEFTSSALSAGSGQPRDVNPLRVEGTLVAGRNNFGTLAFAGPRTDRSLTMRTFATDGTLLWEHTVAANDLRTPRE